MGKLFGLSWGNDKKDTLTEEIKAFSGKGDYGQNISSILSKRGEGWESLAEIPGFNNIQVQGFNLFYNSYINRVLENEIQKITEYRQMANTPEISDVIEDAVNESTQEDDVGDLFHLNIKDKGLISNENIVNNLKREFTQLFNETLDIKSKIWDMLWSYYIDGRLYYERVIDQSKPKQGIINIKKLPAETMDFYYNPVSGKITHFLQYLRPKTKKPSTIEEARMMANKNELILFDPNQIGFIDYGIYGKSRYEISGYLDKARVPFNQLKLLETAVIIMRIVRAPERYVFRIDTGNMPRDKALKYVEKIKQKMTKKQSYDPVTGNLSNEPDVMSILQNFFLPQCIDINTYIDLLDGRSISLKQLIEEHNNGKEHEVYSIDQKTGKIIRGKVEWAGITRKNTELLRVYLDNGRYVDCTPDHRFVMRDGREVEAQNLKPNDSLMSLNDEIKVSILEKLNYKNDTGCLTIKDPGENHNFGLSVGVFVKNSADGRGSQIDTIGGNTNMFSELDDVYYFQRKLYRALKYPSSRIQAAQENRSGDVLFGGQQTSEISRDEIKWASFLERQQKILCKDLTDMFILHLEFRGMKEQYDITKRKIEIIMNPPSKYKEQQQQMFNDSRFSNYQQLADRNEFSKYYLMKRYLHWDDEEIKANVEGKKKDIELGLAEEESGGNSSW